MSMILRIEASAPAARPEMMALIQQAANSPGVAVDIPAELTARMASESAAGCREAILAIRRRERPSASLLSMRFD